MSNTLNAAKAHTAGYISALNNGSRAPCQNKEIMEIVAILSGCGNADQIIEVLEQFEAGYKLRCSQEAEAALQ